MSAAQPKRACNEVTVYGFAVVVCQHPDGRYLAVDESRDRGWWLPAGKLDPNESYAEAALRETKEEAGIDVDLKGILRVEYSMHKQYARMRVVYYATPKDPNAPLKSVPDKESNSARWVTVQDLLALAKQQPGLRGPELLDWGRYLDAKRPVYPLSIFADESDPPAMQ